MFYGVQHLTNPQVITDPNLTVTVKRSWKERLFTLPWEPLKAFKEEPDYTIYLSDGKMTMHPELYRLYGSQMR